MHFLFLRIGNNWNWVRTLYTKCEVRSCFTLLNWIYKRRKMEQMRNKICQLFWKVILYLFIGQLMSKGFRIMHFLFLRIGHNWNCVRIETFYTKCKVHTCFTYCSIEFTRKEKWNKLNRKISCLKKLEMIGFLITLWIPWKLINGNISFGTRWEGISLRS